MDNKSTPKTTKKSYILHLPCHNQGDDLSWAWGEAHGNDADAFGLYAELLAHSVRVLFRLSCLAQFNDMEIEDAEGHFISVACSQEIGDQLVKEKILYEEEDEEEEDYTDKVDPTDN